MGRRPKTLKEKEDAGDRRTCTLDPVTWRRMQKLAKGKWYGATAAKVMTRFIEDGIRQARADGYLTLDD